MTITTDNYELYFYRYAEGELSPQERAEVEAFAAQHPDLAEELALYDPQLKLAAAETAYPNKEQLLRRGAAVLPLWRWAAAACVAVLLLGAVCLLWPADKAPQQVEELRLPERIIEAKESAEPMEPTEPTVSPEPNSPAPKPAPKPVRHTPTSAPQDPSAPATQVPTTLVAEVTQDTPEPATQDHPEPAPQDPSAPATQNAELSIQNSIPSTVIEYTDIVLATPYYVEVVADSAEEVKVRTRIRALRSRVNNTLRDYAYQAYAHTRGELLALADR